MSQYQLTNNLLWSITYIFPCEKKKKKLKYIQQTTLDLGSMREPEKKQSHMMHSLHHKGYNTDYIERIWNFS